MDFALARKKLVDSLSRDIRDERVLAAMSRVPREIFVPENLRDSAYDDGPLPIGFDQTISQPFIVALMTQALALTEQDTVLEIGTGSGYQTAILAELAASVVTVERLPALAETARRTLDELGYTNVSIKPAGEKLGWPEDGPYNGIIITAGAPRVPVRLMAQLAIGGRMVIPVGSRNYQELYKITRNKSGNRVENLGGCRFVPLIGYDAWGD